MIDLNKTKQLISKRAILQYYNELDVYRMYIEGDVELKKIILSPLRRENRPSFGFFIGESGEICFKDLTMGVGGDFVKFVQLKFNLTYFEALSQIAIDLGINDEYICKNLSKKSDGFIDNMPSKETLLASVVSSTLGKNRRAWQTHDKDFWQSFGISYQTLLDYRVEPISYIHVNNRIYLADKHAYCFTEVKDGLETYKIYQPFNDNLKWINNHDNSVWSGWEQLPEKGDILILTKSLKDVMALKDVCNIPAVSLQSENLLPKRHVFEQLTKRFQLIYTLYDNDFDKEVNIGRMFGDRVAEEYGLIPLYIDEQYQCKDFSDLVKKVGTVQAKEILTKKTMIPF